MYRRGEVSQTARALRLLDALRGYKHGRTLADLARELDVSERTIRRDLADLDDAAVRIKLTRIGDRTAARLVESGVSAIAVTRRERYTLLAVRRAFDVLRGTPLHDDILSVLAKLEQPMTASERTEHVALAHYFAYVPDGGTKAYDGMEDVIDALLTGIMSRKIVQFAYKHSRGRARRGELAPFALLMYRQGLYVVGCRVEESNDVTDWRRTFGVFAVERFTEAEHLRKRTFEAPADFKIEEMLHGAFGIHIGDPAKACQVGIEFSREKADLVTAREWHPTQRITRNDHGKVTLAFTCTNLLPVVSWVLEWGPHARAVEPPELVTAIIDELDRARAQYLPTR